MPPCKLVPKSVRLPADLVAFVESKKGRTFSQKLIYVLEDYRAGDDIRLEEIEQYDALLERKRAELSGYYDIIAQASRISAACARLIEAGSAMFPEKGHEHLPRDAALPLSPEESELVELYRNAGMKGREYILQYAQSF